MPDPSLTLVARLASSAADSRRGVVRLHPEVLDALGLRSWDAVRLTGSRVTAALVVAAGPDAVPGQARLDDVTLSNAGLTDGGEIVVSRAAVAPARRLTLAGSRLAATAVRPETARLALMGKVLGAGDAVSLLPQDIAPPPGADVHSARRALSAAIGGGWTTELLTVAEAEPAGTPVAVVPSTVVGWRGGSSTGDDAPVAAAPARVLPSAGPAAGTPAPAAEPPAQEELVLPIESLAGNVASAKRLVEWLDLTISRPELLSRLGGSPRLGVLLSGPEGVGKATLVRSAAAAVGARCVELVGPAVAALEPAAAVTRVRELLARARSGDGPAVLMVNDVHALLPAASPPPLATIVLDELRAATAPGGPTLVATTSEPEGVDPRLRAPDLVDRELTASLPDAATRRDLLEQLLRDVPCADDVDLADVAGRAPGFVVADLVAVRREAAIQAALRAGSPRTTPGTPSRGCTSRTCSTPSGRSGRSRCRTAGPSAAAA